MSRFAIYGLLLAGMAFYGSATPVSKLVTQQFPVLAGAAARLLLAGMLLLPFALHYDPAFLRRSRKDWAVIAGVAIIGNIGFSVFMLYGMQMVSGVTGSVIMSLVPAVTALGAVLFMGEKINTRKIGALALGVAGALLLQLFSGGNNDSSGSLIDLGALLIFAAVCCEAAYTLLGKLGTNDMTAMTLTTLSALMAGLILLPLLLWQWPQQAITAASMSDWLAIFWWGAGTMALGTLCWYRGLKDVPGHVAAGFMVIMPISALLLSYLLLGEAFRWLHIPGFGLALGSVLLMVVEHRKQ